MGSNEWHNGQHTTIFPMDKNLMITYCSVNTVVILVFLFLHIEIQLYKTL